MARKSLRSDLLDWCQGIVDTTKDFVDDNVGRLRGRRGTLERELDKLRESLLTLSDDLDEMTGATLSRARRSVAVDDFYSMTKAELQTYADEHGIADVDQHAQSKAAMVAALRRHARLGDAKTVL